MQLIFRSKTAKLAYNCIYFILIGMSFQPARAQEVEFSIFIARPGEGETFYAGLTSLLYRVPITGWVISPGVNFEDIRVRLDIFQDQNLVSSEITKLLQNGTFEFFAVVNPKATDDVFDPMNKDCTESCHTQAALDLPKGHIILLVTATGPDGQIAYDERHIIVDNAVVASIPVIVELIGHSDQTPVGIPVQATTWLYMWRARTFTGSTDEHGIANMRVEVPNESPTKYVFKVEPVNLNGIRYESIDSVEVIFPAGAKIATPIALNVTAHLGQISGMINYLDKPPGTGEPITLTAIRVSDGISYKSIATKENTFLFPNLLIDQYLVIADNSLLIPNGLFTTVLRVDLTKEILASIEMPVKTIGGDTLRGRILNEQGIPLPFAWITREIVDDVQSVLPNNGAFMFYDLPKKDTKLLVRAPGYYSKEQAIALSNGSFSEVDIILSPQHGTQSVAWGNGKVILPAESQVEIIEQDLILRRGWVWGYGDGIEPFVIKTGSVEISLLNAKFALEFLPNTEGWLFVFDGQATVRSLQGSEAVTVHAGEMINLSDSKTLKSLPYDPVVLTALRSENYTPLPFVWESSLVVSVRDWLAQIGVGMAQVITFSTYIIVIFSLLLFPLVGLYWWLKRNRS